MIEDSIAMILEDNYRIGPVTSMSTSDLLVLLLVRRCTKCLKRHIVQYNIFSIMRLGALALNDSDVNCTNMQLVPERLRAHCDIAYTQ